MPPLALNDDAKRGLLAALKLLRIMRGLAIKCYIAVASWLVCTGLLGSHCVLSETHNVENKSFVSLIESPIGTGKTTLIESIVHCSNKNEINKKFKKNRVIWVSGHHYVTTSQTIWSSIFGTLLSHAEFTENQSYRQHDVFGTQFLETEEHDGIKKQNVV